MLIGFSHHHDNPRSNGSARADDFRALSDYMEMEFVLKRIGTTQTSIRRDPLPEILCGAAPTLRREIASLPFKRKYRFALLSFDHGDIDIAAFNAGDPDARRPVALALSGFREALWPGVPAIARPHVFATTHTHVGRLEVNIAFARAVFAQNRPARSFNPDPPTPLGRPPQYWCAFRDLLNHHFGWADPEDPARLRDIVTLDWKAKADAEARRAGIIPAPMPYEAALEMLQHRVTAGEIRSRADVLAFLGPVLAEFDWAILSTAAKSITIGAPSAPPRARVKLKGTIMAANFTGALDPADIAVAQRARAATLAAAPERFQAMLRKRADYNRKTYGFEPYYAPDWTVAQWLETPHSSPAAQIPRRHHVLMLRATSHNKDKITDETFGDRPEISGSDASHRNRAEARDIGPNAADGRRGTTGLEYDTDLYGDDRAIRASMRSLDQLERKIRRLAGPVGAVAAIAYSIRSVTSLLPAAGPMLAAARLSDTYDHARIDHFAKIATDLEALNARTDIHFPPNPRPEPRDQSLAPGYTRVGDRIGRSERGGSSETTAYGRDPGSDVNGAGADRDPSGSDLDAVLGDYESAQGHARNHGKTERGHHDGSQVAGGFDQTDFGSGAYPQWPRIGQRSLAATLQTARSVARTLAGDGVGKLSRITAGLAYEDNTTHINICTDSIKIWKSELPIKELGAALAPIAQIYDLKLLVRSKARIQISPPITTGTPVAPTRSVEEMPATPTKPAQGETNAAVPIAATDDPRQIDVSDDHSLYPEPADDRPEDRDDGFDVGI